MKPKFGCCDKGPRLSCMYLAMAQRPFTNFIGAALTIAVFLDVHAINEDVPLSRHGIVRAQEGLPNSKLLGCTKKNQASTWPQQVRMSSKIFFMTSKDKL